MSENRARCMSQVRRQKQEREFTLSLPLHSISASDELDDTGPGWKGQISLLSPLNQMLMSSRNTLTDTPRNMLSAIWVSQPNHVTHEIHYHGEQKQNHPQGHVGSMMKR